MRLKIEAFLLFLRCLLAPKVRLDGKKKWFLCEILIRIYSRGDYLCAWKKCLERENHFRWAASDARRNERDAEAEGKIHLKAESRWKVTVRWFIKLSGWRVSSASRCGAEHPSETATISLSLFVAQRFNKSGADFSLQFPEMKILNNRTSHSVSESLKSEAAIHFRKLFHSALDIRTKDCTK